MHKLTFDDIKPCITSISDTEKLEMEIVADIMCQIIRRRKNLNMTQRKLAKLTGIEQAAISRIERMQNVPQIDTLIRLIKPLGLKLELGSD
jgi:predicted transcriptional regulator